MSGDEIVVLISTTALPSWSATLITADSSVTLLVMGASGPMPPATPVGATLIRRGATRIVAAVPARAPTSALITTIPRMPMRRRGVAGLTTGRGDRGAGSEGGVRNCGSLAIELSPILRWPVSATGQRKPRKDQLFGPQESCLLVEPHRLRVVLARPDGGEGHVPLTKQLHRLAQQLPPDSLGAESRIDVDLGDFRLEAGAWIEEHAPTETHDLTGGARCQDDVLAGESGGGGGRHVALDLLLGQLWMVVVPLLRHHQLAQQRPYEVVLGRIENGDRDLRRVGSLYGFAAVGTPSSTLRSAWAAPSKPAVSTGTTSLAFSLLANFESVSSCRMETNVGSGAASLIAL